MAAGVTRSILKVPGRLVKDPTDLTAAYPYGGTELGLAKEVELRFRTAHHEVKAEEWGDQTVDVVYGGTSVFLACSLRGMDDDAMAAVHYDTATGSPSNDEVVRFRVDNGRAGTLASTKSMKLLYVPDSRLRHRAVILRDALPVLAEDARLQVGQSVETVTNVVFYGRPDGSDRVAEIAYIKDLSL